MAAKRRRGGAKAEGDAGAAIDAELERVNDLLQQEETSQKRECVASDAKQRPVG